MKAGTDEGIYFIESLIASRRGIEMEQPRKKCGAADPSVGDPAVNPEKTH